MQAIKAPEREDARYRAVADYPKDVDIQAVLQCMRYVAREELRTFHGGRKLDDLQWPPLHHSDKLVNLLLQAQRRSWRVRKLQDAFADQESGGLIAVENLRTEYAELLEDLPETWCPKFGQGAPNAPAVARMWWRP